jgi:hypothetical protein
MVTYHTNQANAVIAHNVASEAKKNRSTTVSSRNRKSDLPRSLRRKKAKREIGKM